MELTKYQMDELKEVGNIGAGNTSVALSKLIGKEVGVEMTELKVLPLKEFSNVKIKSPDKFVGILLGIEGDIEGNLILLSPEKDSLGIVDMMSSQEVGTSKTLGELETEGLKELGNILVGSYLMALADLSDLKIIEGLPFVINGKRDTVVKDMLDKCGKSDHALIVGTKLVIDKQKLEEEIILILKKDSFESLFCALSKFS